MKPALLPIAMAVATALTVAAVSSRAQAPGVYALHEVPEGATLHKVTAAPAEYKGRKALKVEFTEAANKERPGGGGDMPTFVLIPTNLRTVRSRSTFSAVSTERVCRTRGRSSGSPTASTTRRASRRSICARSTAVRKIHPPRATSARSSTSPIRTGNSAGCARSIRTGATSPAPILPMTNGSRSSSTSTTRASECRPTARRNSR